MTKTAAKAKCADSLSDQLRAAVKAAEADGRTRYALCKASGVDQAALSRFMGGRDLALSTAGQLASVLGLELRPIKRRTK